MGSSPSGEKYARWLGSFALLLSLVAYLLGPAPLSAAIVLTYLSMPAACTAFLLGAIRLSALAFYFGALAWCTVPLADALPIRLDYLLALFLALGGMLGVFFYSNYRRVGASS